MTQHISFDVTGVSPLLMNSPHGMIAQAAQRKGVNTRRIPEPEVEAEGGAYRLSDGTLYFPTLAFRRALIDAGKGRRVGSSRRGANTVMAGSVFIPDGLLETRLVDPSTGEFLEKYELDLQRAVPPRQGAVIRARPRLDRWAAVVTFDVDTDVIPLDLVEALFTLAGSSVGVGNFRPQKGGVYGRFNVQRM